MGNRRKKRTSVVECRRVTSCVPFCGVLLRSGVFYPSASQATATEEAMGKNKGFSGALGKSWSQNKGKVKEIGLTQRSPKREKHKNRSKAKFIDVSSKYYIIK